MRKKSFFRNFDHQITCFAARTELNRPRFGDFFNFNEPVCVSVFDDDGNVKLCVNGSMSSSSSMLKISSSSAIRFDSLVCGCDATFRLYFVNRDGSPKPSAMPVTRI